MKKTLLFIILCVTLLFFNSCGKNDEEVSSDNDLTEPAVTASSTQSDIVDSEINSDSSSMNLSESTSSDSSSDLSKISSSQKIVENFIKNLILGNCDGTEIDSLTVMEARNTDSTDDYKVFAIITWKGEDTPTNSQKTLQNYSKNVAAFVDAKLGNVQYLSLSWLVPNLNGSACLTYEKTDGMLSLKEEAFDDKFGKTSESTESTTISAVQNN